jgi:hypothetical protein
MHGNLPTLRASGPDLTAHERGAAVVLTPAGAFDSDLIVTLGRRMLEIGPRPIVVDLSDCVIIAAHRPFPPGGWLRPPHSLCFVCRRLAGRRILRRLVEAGWPVFPTVETALQTVDERAGTFVAH